MIINSPAVFTFKDHGDLHINFGNKPIKLNEVISFCTPPK